ncbi:MAG TPA: histidine kinase, partial [Anaerolineales bacterium]|nr:histidine kinase [Anaerolineales bacterium]
MAKERNGDHFESVFEYAPISLWEEDYSRIKIFFDSLRADVVTDLAHYFEEHPQEVETNMRRIEVINVNRETLQMFGAC